jgi:hypothetical protein
MMARITFAALWLALLIPTHAETYNNPVLWNDLADLDVFRVNDTYYYSTSDDCYLRANSPSSMASFYADVRRS